MTLWATEVRKLYHIQTERDVDRAVERLLRYDILGFDTETYHSVNRYIHAFNPDDGARMRLAQFGTPDGDAYVFNLFKINREFLYRMFPNPYLLVGQNLKFDLKFLMYELGIYDFGPLFDTMLAEQVIAKGNAVQAKDLKIQKTRVTVGLGDTVQRRLKVYLPKDEQAGDWYKTELSQQQIEYAGRDAYIVLPLYQKQADILRQQSQHRVSEIEFDAVPAVGVMELNGIYLNQSKWLEVVEKTQREIDEIKAELGTLLGNQNTLFAGARGSVNLNSSPQVIKAFQDKGIKVPLDRDGKLSIRRENIEHLKGHYKEIELFLKYVKMQKHLSSFGANWLNLVNPFDGRIHCSLKQIGAETGRLAADKPNMMQIPKSNDIRNCFEAQFGWVFVDADYSQCELRILAELCRDPNMLEAFDKQYDLHRFSAHLIFKVAMEIVTDIQRGIAKNLNFGIVYGIGVKKFADQAGISQEEAQIILNYYLEKAYPGLGHWLERQGRSIFNTGLEAYTMTGRIRQYQGNVYDKEEKAAMQRNAKNLPIQGTNADITKRAMALTYRELVKRRIMQTHVKMILPIHDELILESRPQYAFEAEHLLKECMLTAEREWLQRVPSVVDSNITTVWCKEPLPIHLEMAQEVLGLAI